MAERLYSEDEVKSIFERAADPDVQRRLASTSGMTLTELQEIGREVGLSAEAVARAAASLETPAPAAMPRFLGLPIGVSRSVQLPRALTEEEWQQLVVDLRTTFHAHGKLEALGNTREWSNGNLRASLMGSRFQLQSVKGAARGRMKAGLINLGISAGMAVFSAISGAGMETATGVLALVGSGLLVSGMAVVPAWARRRREQFEQVIARLLALTSKQ